MTRPARFPLGLKQLHSGRGPRPLVPEPLRPQRPLHEAAQDAARRQPPSGLGLDSAAVRERMVRRLRAEGLGDERVLAAMAAVPRHRFVDTALANQAYEDTSLPIGWQQTISKPSVVARMLALLAAGEGARAAGHLGRVLEIGTGCGYKTALLACLARQVVSIERLAPLHARAREHLAPALGVLPAAAAPIQLLHGDGRLGHAPRAPYDALIAAAGGDQLPSAWLEQLAPRGRLVAPMHDAARGGQVLVVVDRLADGSWLTRQHEAVHFVPLESGTA